MLSLFLAVCTAVLAALWRRLRGLAGYERGLALGALGMWGHLLAHSLVDNLFVHEMYLLMALLIGVALVYGSVGAVEEALLQTIGGLGRLLNYTLCELTKS